MKLIKDPVHGYLSFRDEELAIVDTYAVQRLRRITQLPFVYLVYPGARHSRFDHSLGCMYLAGEFAEKLGLDDYRRRVLRIAGLLHDVGHAPYSHLFETLLNDAGLSHESMTCRIIREDDELAGAIEGCGVDPRDVLEVLEGRADESSIISGPIDADKLDFLMRDAYFTGAPYGIIDTKRIIFRSRLIDGKLVLNINAVGAVEEMALARYQNFMNIYFHHTVRAAQIIFLAGARKLEELSNIPSMSVEEYLSYDDYVIWCMMKRNKEAAWAVERVERRKIPKVAYELRVGEDEFPREILRDVRVVGDKIASMAGVPDDNVWIDTPYITPLPFKGDEYVQFYEEEGGEIKVAEHRSPLLEFTSKIYGIIRVYTDQEYLEDVRRAAKKYFG
ncbi:MAG: HD domain-containing protein [Nitrososphaerota archaeon]|nr:HD domain-containing protein [Nitrososphaerota archaeon]